MFHKRPTLLALTLMVFVPSVVNAKPIFWKQFQNSIISANKTLPIQTDSITSLNSLEIDKKRKVLIYNYKVDTENVEQIDLEYIRKSLLINDCYEVNKENFNSPVKSIQHNFVALDGSTSHFEISEAECLNGLDLDGFDTWSSSIEIQNENLPMVVDEQTTLRTMSTNKKEQSLTYHYELTGIGSSELDVKDLKERTIQTSCSSLKDFWLIPLSKTHFNYLFEDGVELTFSIMESECNIESTAPSSQSENLDLWEQFALGIAAENENLSQSQEPFGLKEMTINKETRELTYIIYMDISTVTEELPNVDNVRRKSLENNCEGLASLLGMFVQKVNFKMVTIDGTHRSTSLTAEECAQGLDAVE